MAKYNPSLGIYGNIKKLFTEHNSNRNIIYNNKATQDSVNENTEDLMCDLDDIQRIADLETAVLELEAMIGELTNE